MKRCFLAACAGALLALLTTAATAETLPAPTGPVVLTVGGTVGNTNRGPFDPTEDLFLGFHEAGFERAVAFDLAMLERLPQREMVIDYPGWPAPARFEGPAILDLLSAVSADGDRMTVLALDGFATEIGPEDLASYDWIVALKRDGRYLGLGARGPLWLLYTRRDGQPLSHEDEQSWPWGVFFIEIE